MLQITTTVDTGEQVYTVNSSSFEDHEASMVGVKALFTRDHRHPVCVHCGQRFEIGEDEKFCSLECAEDHLADLQESIATNN